MVKGEKSEKNSHLMAQIGILVLLLFGIALILNAVAIMINQIRLSIRYVNETSMNLAEFVGDEMESNQCMSWFFDYLEEHGDLIKTRDYDYEEGYTEQENGELDEILMSPSSVTSERAREFSADGQYSLAIVMYSYLLDNIDKSQRIISGLELKVSRKTDDDHEYVFYQGDSDRDQTSEFFWIDEAGYTNCLKEIDYHSHTGSKYSFGELHDYWFDGEKGQKPEDTYEVIRDPGTDDGSWILCVYRPIVVDGETVAIITAERTWSTEEMLHMVLAAGNVEGANAMYLFICGVVLLILVYLVAVRPLSNLQQYVREYKNDKDTTNVIKNLSKIRSKNEIGRLADDISEMSGEIDDYAGNLLLVTAEKERIGAELNVASQIQVGILPKIEQDIPYYPDRDDFEIYASMSPAKEVGGDLYDFFLLDDDHLALIIGDVSGKGVPAAMFMAITTTLIRYVMQNSNLGISEVVESVNSHLCEGNENMMFVTLWAGVLEFSTGKVVCSNGGHDYPMIRKKDGLFEEIKTDNDVALGIMPDIEYTETSFQLEPGDTLYLYTDGVPEATNSNNELFGISRLLDALNEDPGRSPQQLDGIVQSKVAEFVGKADQFDDMTMLCVKRRTT